MALRELPLGHPGGIPRTRRAAAIVNKVSSGGRTRTGTTCGQRRSYHPISRIAPENRF